MKQLMNTDDYNSYKEKQWKNVDRVYELKLFSKHIDMIERLVSNIEDTSNKKVLCIGARYGIEMLAFEQMGFAKENIIGIDIYPRQESIFEADMHNLPFEKETFDIVYSHHSIDHSLFPQKALDEISRVSKKGTYWVFSIPFDDYGKEEAIDFDSDLEIFNFLKQYNKEFIYQLSVIRNKEGFVLPIETWLPNGWKNELRIILK